MRWLLLLFLVPGLAAAPIEIIGDDALANSAWVSSGTGTTADPFIIEGLDLQDGPVGLSIQDVTSSFLLRDIAVDGTTMNTGIHLANVTDARIERIEMEGPREQRRDRANGILVDGAADVQARDITVRNSSGSGLWFQDVDRLRVDQVLVTDAGWSGVWIDRVRGGHLQNATTLRVGFNGLYLCNTDDFLVANNVFSANRNYGGDMTDSHRNILRDNTFADNDEHGIMLIDSNDNVLHGNTFLNNGGAAVNFRGGDDNIGYDNVFEGNRYDVLSGDLFPPTESGETSEPTPFVAPWMALALLAWVARFRS